MIIEPISNMSPFFLMIIPRVAWSISLCNGDEINVGLDILSGKYFGPFVGKNILSENPLFLLLWW